MRCWVSVGPSRGEGVAAIAPPLKELVSCVVILKLLLMKLSLLIICLATIEMILVHEKLIVLFAVILLGTFLLFTQQLLQAQAY
jgi:hypothetical protein